MAGFLFIVTGSVVRAEGSGSGIPGYAMGSGDLGSSPLAVEDFELLKQTVLFTEDDVRYLRMSRDVLAPQVEDVLDVWYGFVASQPQLLQYFSHPKTGEAQGEYLGAVRMRFARWILDTAEAEYDQDWLDWQHEIGRRHHRLGKNATDGATAAPHIHYRYLPALLYPVTATLKPFLGKGGHSEEEVEGMHQAWVKSVLLQVILWSEPYVKEGDF